MIIGSGNGLSPVRRQAITWTDAALLSMEPLGTNFRDIFLIHENSFETVVCGIAAILSQGERT